MTLFYLDSSAWVKRPQSEAGSLWMSRLWRPGVPFACATLGLVEVLCTIARRHAANSVDPSLTAAVLKSVHEDFEAFVRVELDDATLPLRNCWPRPRPKGFRRLTRPPILRCRFRKSGFLSRGAPTACFTDSPVSSGTPPTLETPAKRSAGAYPEPSSGSSWSIYH